MKLLVHSVFLGPKLSLWSEFDLSNRVREGVQNGGGGGIKGGAHLWGGGHNNLITSIIKYNRSQQSSTTTYNVSRCEGTGAVINDSVKHLIS